MPLVSIVIPVYNYERYVGECIRSVLNQTFQNLELILSDDQSADDSLAVIRSFSDPRIRIICNPRNGGPAYARNQGVVAATGEYIAFLDADDLLTKDSLALRVAFLESQQVDLVCAQAADIPSHFSLEKAYALPDAPVTTKVRLFHNQTILMRRSLFRAYGLFDEQLLHREDKEYWWRLFGRDYSRRDRATFAHLPQRVAYYRVHAASRTAYYLGLPNRHVWSARAKEAYQSRYERIDSSNTRMLDD